MARQNAILGISGSLDGKTYYRFKGKDYVKNKSTLNKERFDTDPAFEGSRKMAALTKITAPLASKVYQQLPVKLKKHGLIGKMTGEASRLLRSGLSPDEITVRLFLKFDPNGMRLKELPHDKTAL